ncbi:RebB family R body protein [Arenicella xantha]|uniref:Killing trait domain-containing protein n=1 Tax=Arenicella xantha TaxID=644221 RepID=A0A395JRP0_9GAMM|nr:RebB family R body protein [Arenicella xantha]RBP53106.1 killing trait domain-containing protein [Arenicella xantha]
MIDESSVNSQTTDSVSQVNTLLLGTSASQSIGLLEMVSAETLGMSMHNAVTAQQNSQMSTSASVTASCAKMLQAAPSMPPTVAPPPAPSPPPFMPLEPDTDKTAGDYVKEATTMAEEAIAMMEKDATATAADKKSLKALLAKLQTITGKKDTAKKNAPKPGEPT